MVIRHIYIDFLLIVIISRLFLFHDGSKGKKHTKQGFAETRVFRYDRAIFLKPFARSELDGVV